MTLKELFNIDDDTKIVSIEEDSRKVVKGSVFVCINGLTVDGHNYADKAVQNGAILVVSERKLDVGVHNVIVDNSYDAFANLNSKFYDYPSLNMKMIGVTGTDGKTTTSTIIYQMLKDGFKAGYMGTNGVYYNDKKLESNMTTPPANVTVSNLAKMKNDGVDVVSMEVGSHSLQLKRVASLLFDIMIFTNLTHEHLNDHGTMENYFKIKSKLFEMNKNDNNNRIINVDDKYGKILASKYKNRCLTYGINNDADFSAKNIKLYDNRTTFTFSYKNKDYEIESPLLGIFNVYNLLSAIAALTCLNLDIETIKEKILNISNIDGRMMIVKGHNKTAIVDFAHTENGLKCLIDYVNQIKTAKTWIVLGSAGERDTSKRSDMGKLVVDMVDNVIFTMEDPRNESVSDIIKDMTKDLDGENYKIIEDRKEAILYALSNSLEDDIVLVTGKGNDKFHYIKNDKIELCDYEIVYNYLNKKDTNR